MKHRYCYAWCFPRVPQPQSTRRQFKCLRCIVLSKGCELSHPVEDYAQHLGHTMVELAQGGRRLTFRRAPDANAWHGAFPAEPTPATGAVVAAVAAAAAPAEVDNAVAVSATPTAQAGSSRPAQPVVGYVPVSALARETQDAIANLPAEEPRKQRAKPKDKGKAKAAPARSQPTRTVATRSAKTTAPGSPIVVSDGEDDKVGGSRRDGDGDGEKGSRPSASGSNAQSVTSKRTQSSVAQSSRRGAQGASSSKIAGPSRSGGRKEGNGRSDEFVTRVEGSTKVSCPLEDPSSLSPRAMTTVCAEPPGLTRDTLLNTELKRLELERVEVGSELTRALGELSVSAIPTHR